MTRRPIRAVLGAVLTEVFAKITDAKPWPDELEALQSEIEAIVDMPLWLPMDTAPESIDIGTREFPRVKIVPFFVHFGDGQPPLAVYRYCGSLLPCRRGDCLRTIPEPVAWMPCPPVPAAPQREYAERKTKKELADAATTQNTPCEPVPESV